MKLSDEGMIVLYEENGLQIREVTDEVAQLEAELERKTECIHIMEDDTACLPENVSVTEYVTFLQEQLEQSRQREARLLEACIHAVRYSLPYEDESGVVRITLQSYALIKRQVLKEE